MPNSPQAGGIQYRCFYLPDIRFKFNFSEISVMVLKANDIVTIVKFVDNYNLHLYI